MPEPHGKAKSLEQRLPELQNLQEKFADPCLDKKEEKMEKD